MGTAFLTHVANINPAEPPFPPLGWGVWHSYLHCSYGLAQAPSLPSPPPPLEP